MCSRGIWIFHHIARVVANEPTADVNVESGRVHQFNEVASSAVGHHFVDDDEPRQNDLRQLIAEILPSSEFRSRTAICPSPSRSPWSIVAPEEMPRLLTRIGSVGLPFTSLLPSRSPGRTLNKNWKSPPASPVAGTVHAHGVSSHSPSSALPALSTTLSARFRVTRSAPIGSFSDQVAVELFAES